MPPDWLIEFVAVALGVYLALWAQRRAERSANRRLEGDFTADLLVDLDSDLAEIDAMETRVAQYASAVRTLLTEAVPSVVEGP